MMGLFRKSNKEKDEFVKYDEIKNDADVEKLKKLLIKATHKKNEEEREEREKATETLNSLQSQIKSAREEYNTIVSEIMPVKYELAEKKAQIEKLRGDYEAILSRIKHAKTEFESLDTKLAKRRQNEG